MFIEKLIMPIYRVPVSSISAICGRHRWQCKHKAKEKWFEQYNKKCSKKRQEFFAQGVIGGDSLKERVGDDVFQEMTKKFVKQNPSDFKKERIVVKKVKESGVDTMTFTKAKIVNKSLSDSAIKNIAETISDDRVSDQKIKEITKGYLFTDRGTRLEGDTVSRINKKLESLAYTVGCTQFFVSKVFEIPNTDIQYTVNGMLDGILVDNLSEKRAVVEIKNRINRIMIPAPEYDLDQLAVYMQLTDLPLGILAQQHNKKLDLSVTMCMDMANKRWAEIKPLLDECVLWCHEVSCDPSGRLSMDSIENSRSS